MLSSFFRTITFDQDQEHKCGIPCSTISQNWRNFWALHLSWNQFLIQLLKTTGLLRGPLPVQHSHLLWNETDSLIFSSSYIWTIINILFTKVNLVMIHFIKFVLFWTKFWITFSQVFSLGGKYHWMSQWLVSKVIFVLFNTCPKSPLKAFVISDSVTGYAFNWELYTGKLLFSNTRWFCIHNCSLYLRKESFSNTFWKWRYTWHCDASHPEASRRRPSFIYG